MTIFGVDLSSDMLAQAAEKNRDAEGIAPIFLCQSMDRLDLYGTIDACVCCLDSINYVTDPKKLRRAFQRVHLFLMPGGLFLFDVNTPAKLEGLDGQVFLDETEDAYCVWRAEYSRRRRVCSYFMDIFRLEEESGLWERGEELHEERAYTPEELTSYLRDAGFTQIKQYGNLKHRPPSLGRTASSSPHERKSRSCPTISSAPSPPTARSKLSPSPAGTWWSVPAPSTPCSPWPPPPWAAPCWPPP
ncbi:MAG: methyltransferase domain-containing protein [Lawsonibacter sp.]